MVGGLWLCSGLDPVGTLENIDTHADFFFFMGEKEKSDPKYVTSDEIPLVEADVAVYISLIFRRPSFNRGSIFLRAWPNTHLLKLSKGPMVARREPAQIVVT